MFSATKLKMVRERDERQNKETISRYFVSLTRTGRVHGAKRSIKPGEEGGGVADRKGSRQREKSKKEGRVEQKSEKKSHMAFIHSSF